VEDRDNGHTDSTDLVHALTDHSHISIVDFFAMSNLFAYTITYKYTNRSLALDSKGFRIHYAKEYL